MSYNEHIFGKDTERIKKVCENCRIDFARACKCFEYLKTDPNFQKQGDAALIDYVESRIKMVSFGAILAFPGEEVN